MADPKKSYNDILTWAKGTSNDIIAKQLATARTISITNNSGTALASGTFNGTGNLTLKLPATVGIDISGNAATATSATSATYATNVRITPTDGVFQYPIVLSPGNSANTNYTLRTAVNNDDLVSNSGLRCSPGLDVAAGTESTTILCVGNALAKSAADNRTGRIDIYGNTGKATRLTQGNPSSDITLNLPATSGTIALTSDVPSSSVPSSGAGNACTTYTSMSSYTNTSHTMEVLFASFYTSYPAATITNGSTTIMEQLSVHIPGTDGKGRYPALSTSTFILLKGDKITFTDAIYAARVRVIMP